jgi:hypothetical protein
MLSKQGQKGGWLYSVLLLGKGSQKPLPTVLGTLNDLEILWLSSLTPFTVI